MPEVIEPGGGSTATIDYTLIAAVKTPRVTGDNTVQDVIAVTAQSDLYGVTYSWFVEPENWTVDGGPPLIQEKTGQVNAIMQHAHVIGFRSQQDQDASRLLVNYGIVTVGNDDGSIQDEVSIRMDMLGTPAAFTAIDATWAKLVAVSGGALS
jgi:hypothetical protein